MTCSGPDPTAPHPTARHPTAQYATAGPAPRGAGPAGADLSGVPRAAALPRMVRVRQPVRGPRVADAAAATRDTLAALGLGALPGRRIAVAVGSRGIADVVPVVAACVAHLRALGAEPFVVPGMGSHGGATEAGQREVLAGLGVTERSVGCPVVCATESVPVAEALGAGTLMLRPAAEADHVVVVNRVKPHTDFSGGIESGLAKMLAIGLGGPDGAVRQHRLAARLGGLERVVVAGAEALLATGRPLFGLGIVENGGHTTALVEAVGPDRLLGRERELLRLAKEWTPRLPVDDLDVLLVDQFGKDVSGAGMDSKVVGRHSVPFEPPFTTPRIRYLVAGELTPVSHGNAAGIGNADFVTRRLAEAVDWSATYRNSLTSGSPASSRCPVVVPTLDDGLRIAVGALGLPDPTEARVVRIRNTLALAEIDVSASLLDACGDDVTVLGPTPEPDPT
ncbi:hypothetical protein [Streptomyces sp. B6B3]|uniref:hypothetical protein n=1 Tax=Streptomyces sp. B6B3 TaxID=3153570 RepID=UPI00325F3B56